MAATIVRLLLVSITLILLDTTCLLAESKDNVSIQNRLDRIETSLSEIRRDQLNYKIEKDLLKETFSSNYQTINIVLTIVLGMFTIVGILGTIVGILGIRDISATRKEYLAELERINTLRKDLEIKLSKIGEEQEKVKTDYLEIIKVNEEQGRKIKVLELQEKISSLIKSRNYRRALEYITVGLNLDPHNTILLDQKARTLWLLNDLEGAVMAYTDLLKEDPGNKAAITNLLELFLISKRIKDFDQLYTGNKSWVDQYDDSYLVMYFDLLKNYQLGQQQQVETLTKEYIKRLSDGKKRYLKWDFEDVLNFLKPHPDSRAKKLLTTFVSVLRGEIAKEDALKAIEIT